MITPIPSAFCSIAEEVGVSKLHFEVKASPGVGGAWGSLDIVTVVPRYPEIWIGQITEISHVQQALHRPHHQPHEPAALLRDQPAGHPGDQPVRHDAPPGPDPRAVAPRDHPAQPGLHRLLGRQEDQVQPRERAQEARLLDQEQRHAGAVRGQLPALARRHRRPAGRRSGDRSHGLRREPRDADHHDPALGHRPVADGDHDEDQGQALPEQDDLRHDQRDRRRPRRVQLGQGQPRRRPDPVPERRCHLLRCPDQRARDRPGLRHDRAHRGRHHPDRRHLVRDGRQLRREDRGEDAVRDQHGHPRRQHDLRERHHLVLLQPQAARGSVRHHRGRAHPAARLHDRWSHRALQDLARGHHRDEPLRQHQDRGRSRAGRLDQGHHARDRQGPRRDRCQGLRRGQREHPHRRRHRTADLLRSDALRLDPAGLRSGLGLHPADGLWQQLRRLVPLGL